MTQPVEERYGYADAPMSPKGEEAPLPNRCQSHSGGMNGSPKGEEAPLPNRCQYIQAT